MTGRKAGQRYDHEAIIEMTRTMTRRQIIHKTGISEGYLQQLLMAEGVKPRPKRQQPPTSPRLADSF
jgi:predicted TIM-barrel enzyme